jgi:hypothetical protein
MVVPFFVTEHFPLLEHTIHKSPAQTGDDALDGVGLFVVATASAGLGISLFVSTVSFFGAAGLPENFKLISPDMLVSFKVFEPDPWLPLNVFEAIFSVAWMFGGSEREPVMVLPDTLPEKLFYIIEFNDKIQKLLKSKLTRSVFIVPDILLISKLALAVEELNSLTSIWPDMDDILAFENGPSTLLTLIPPDMFDILIWSVTLTFVTSISPDMSVKVKDPITRFPRSTVAETAIKLALNLKVGSKVYAGGTETVTETQEVGKFWFPNFLGYEMLIRKPSALGEPDTVTSGHEVWEVKLKSFAAGSTFTVKVPGYWDGISLYFWLHKYTFLGLHTTLPGPCFTVRAFVPFGMTPFAPSRLFKGKAMIKEAVVKKI